MASPSLLSTTGKLLHSFFPNLLIGDGPPAEEVTGSDICYLGPNGETDDSNVVLCSALDDGKRPMVGSWYLTPERHVLEWTITTAISFILLFLLYPKLSKYPSSSTGKNVLRPPTLLRGVAFLFFCLMLIYKSIGYSGKIFMIAMPCNVLWCLAFGLSFYPNLSTHVSNIICQLWISYSSLTVAALAIPDTSDLVLPLEKEYFFTMHWLLLFFPTYYLCSGKVSTLPFPESGETYIACFFKWWLFSCILFSIFYVTIVTPLALHSGINLNYMLNPPPTPGDIISGPNYRLWSCVGVFASFFVIRIMASLAELIVRLVLNCPFVVHAELKKKKAA